MCVCVCVCMCVFVCLLHAVEYSAKVSGEATPFLSSGPEGVSFTVSDGLEGIKGIQVAVQTMKKGEHVTLEVKPECE